MANRANEYLVTKRDKSSPYYKSYCESRATRTPAKLPANRASVLNSYFDTEPEEFVNENQGKKVKKQKVKRQRTKGTMKRARRGFIVFLVMLFALLYVVVGALSFLQLDMLEEYNSYVNMFTKVEETPAVDDTAEVTYEAGAGISAKDVIMSFAQKIMGNDKIEGEYYFYNECLATIDSAETVNMIAYYALPVVMVLGILVAVIFFIRALITLCTPKRRKLFILSSVLMLVLSIVGILCGFIWSGMEYSGIMAYLNVMQLAAPMQVGYGYLIMTVLSLLALIASLFAFRSKNKVQ